MRIQRERDEVRVSVDAQIQIQIIEPSHSGSSLPHWIALISPMPSHPHHGPRSRPHASLEDPSGPSVDPFGLPTPGLSFRPSHSLNPPPILCRDSAVPHSLPPHSLAEAATDAGNEGGLAFLFAGYCSVGHAEAPTREGFQKGVVYLPIEYVHARTQSHGTVEAPGARLPSPVIPCHPLSLSIPRAQTVSSGIGVGTSSSLGTAPSSRLGSMAAPGPSQTEHKAALESLLESLQTAMDGSKEMEPPQVWRVWGSSAPHEEHVGKGLSSIGT